MTESIFKTGLVLLIIFCSPLFLISQPRFVPGYYISLDKDTVYGYFKGRVEVKNFKQCRFYPKPGDEPVIYKPGSILAYRFINGKYYISKILDQSDTLFVEYLLNGVADLFYYRDFAGPHYLIEKDHKLIILSSHEDVLYDEDKNSLTKNSNKRTGMLNYLFSDCREIQPEIEDVNLDHSSLIKLTKDYHQYVCKDESCIIYEKKLPAIRIGISPVIGYYISNFKIVDDQYLQSFKFKKAFYPVFGLSVSLNAPRSSEKIFLHLEGTYSQIFTSAFKTFDYYFNNEYHHITIDYSVIKVAMPVSYTFSTGKLRPDVMLGGGMIWTKKPKVNLTIDLDNNGSYIIIAFEKPRIDKWFACGFIRAGVSYHFDKRRSLFLNLGYEISSGLSLEYATYLNSFTIHTGFYF